MEVFKHHFKFAFIFGLFFIVLMEFIFYLVGLSHAEQGRVPPPVFGEGIMSQFDLMFVMVLMGVMFYYMQMSMVLFLASYPIVAFIFFFVFGPVAIAHMLLPVGYSLFP